MPSTFWACIRACYELVIYARSELVTIKKKLVMIKKKLVFETERAYFWNITSLHFDELANYKLDIGTDELILEQNELAPQASWNKLAVSLRANICSQIRACKLQAQFLKQNELIFETYRACNICELETSSQQQFLSSLHKLINVSSQANLLTSL